jgi:transposase
MSHKLKLSIKESHAQLNKLHRCSKPKLQPRIQMLILLKKEKDVISKSALADLLGVSPNSIQRWITLYRKGGLKLLLEDKRGGNRKTVFSKDIHSALEKKLTTSESAFISYRELKQWLEEKFNFKVCYSTLNGYVKRRFGAKLK